MTQTITFPEHMRGDWWGGAIITCTPKPNFDPIDVTTCTEILAQMKTEKTSKKFVVEFSKSNGKITTPAADKIVIAGQVMDIPANIYYADLEITTADGKPLTIFSIEWEIIQDVSRKIVVTP